MDQPQVIHTTEGGIDVEPLYGPWSLGEEWSYDERLGRPGAHPFTRGPDPEMYREQPWIMAMYSGFSTPEETNKRFKELIAAGQTGFSIALDLPTQLGLDSDDPVALGEVGKVGTPIDSLEDMEVLLDGVGLDNLRQIRTTANAIGPMMVALFLCAAERQGTSPESFRILLQNDVLKEYTVRGTYIFPPREGLRLATDVIEYCGRHLPHWTSITVCGTHFREAGASAVQELAYGFVNAMAYLDEAAKRGADLTSMVKTIWLFFNAHSDLFQEVAKFRAARRMWSDLLLERYGIEDEAARALRMFAYTGGSTLTHVEPLNNVVRVALNALGAALGGVQTLGSSSYDEGYSLPSPEAALLSLRTQQILGYEYGVTHTADPLGGSYYVEALTDETEGRAKQEIRAIEEVGGAVRAIETGLLRERVAESAYRWHSELEAGQRVKVGLNAFTRDGTNEGVPPFKTDDEAGKLQSEKLAALRARRDNQRVEESLHELAVAAEKPEVNLVDPLRACFDAYATMGEASAALAGVFGRHQQSMVRFT